MNEQEIAKNKAFDIINSCVFLTHLESAKLFLDLYLETYNDKDSYDELMVLYKQKFSELSIV